MKRVAVYFRFQLMSEKRDPEIVNEGAADPKFETSTLKGEKGTGSIYME